MKEENRKYAQTAYDIVRHAAEGIGSRLPGSEGERKYAAYMGDKLREIGIEPKKEEFSVSPRASIGGISYAGWAGLAISVLAFFALDNHSVWYAMAFASIACLIWLVCSVFLYKRWFDMFFSRRISQNTYGELLPQDGKYDYTIILSGHTDTSWTWKHSELTYKNRKKPIVGIIKTYAKVGVGAVCAIVMMMISIFMAVLYTGESLGAQWAVDLVASHGFDVFLFALHFIPAVTALGSCFVIMWGDPKEETASRGAMDNATGCALSYAVIKYFKENPDKMPKNCRIVDLNCGSEEAGLRGSMAFTAEHKDDDLTENAWNINVDSIADKDYFSVVIKDDWQFTRFDKDMEEMFVKAMDNAGVVSNKGRTIHNPVGGSDSTPMTRAGIKSVTFVAQNPVLTYYYHTWRDMPDRFDMDTVGNGFDIILDVIGQIDQFQQKNGYNGPRKK